MLSNSIFSQKKSLPSKKPLIIDGIDLSQMEELIKSSYPKIETAKDTNVTLLIGPTGAGKSTVVNYLMGCTMEKKYNDGGDCYASPKDLNQARAKTSNGTSSQTLFPETYTSSEGISYCDCPGFSGDRETETARVFESVSTQIAINMAKSIKAVIVVMNYRSILDDRGSTFKAATDLLAKFFIEPEKNASSIIFVFTHADLVGNLLEKKIEEQIDALTKKIKEIIEARKKKLNNKYQIIMQGIADKFDKVFSSVCFWREDDSKKELSEEETKNVQTALENDKQLFNQMSKRDKTAISEMAASLKLLSLMQRSKNLVVLNVFDKGESKNILVDKLFNCTGDVPKSTFNFSHYDSIRNKFDKVGLTILNNGLSELKLLCDTHDKIADCKKNKNEVDGQCKSSEERASQLNENLQKKTEEIKSFKEINNKNLHADKKTKEDFLQKKQGEIKDITNSLDKSQQELKTLNADTPTIYYKDAYYEERSFWGSFFGFGLGWSEHKFEYNGLPFAEYKLDIPSSHGQCINKEANQQEGKLKGTYQSGYGENGNATLKVCLEKRKIPDIALHITNLSKELSELNQKLIKCKEEEKKCITEKNDIEKNIVENNQRSDTKEKSIKEETLGEIERLKHENEKSREEIKKIMEEIKQLNDNLQQKEKSYQEKAELYKQVAKIIVYTGYNDSSTVKDFQITKERWEQQHSLDKISIDNNKLEEKFSIFSDNQKKKEELQNSLEDNFMCPISYEIMRDPVMLLETGITYERKKIEEWLSTHNTCPKTQMELKSKALKPNIALKRSIEDWQEMKMKQQLLNNVPQKF